MKKLSTILAIAGLFCAPAFVSAQTNVTSTTKEVKQTKDTEVHKLNVDEKTVIERQAAKTSLSAGLTERPASRPVNVEAINNSIEALEKQIEENKNNPDFKAEAYEKRLKHLRERRDSVEK